MRNLYIYHFATLTPLVLILFVYSYKYIDVRLFSVFILLYAFIYRPYLDYLRLKSLNLVSRNEWKKFIGLGLIRFKYYNELILGRAKG